MEWLSTAAEYDGSRCLARTLNLRSAEGAGDRCVSILVNMKLLLARVRFPI